MNWSVPQQILDAQIRRNGHYFYNDADGGHRLNCGIYYETLLIN